MAQSDINLFMENYDDAIRVFDEFMLFDDVALHGGGGGHLGDLSAFHHGRGGRRGASFSTAYDEDVDQDHHHHRGLLQVSVDNETAAAGDQGGNGGDSSNCELEERKGARRDRSKTLISERKRRVRMKETLYQLRSLVPTISKMDKASIIADAVAYVKELQSQAKKLEEEINLLESSTSSSPSSKGGRTPDEIIPRRKEEEEEEEEEEQQQQEKKTTAMESKQLYLIMQVNAYDVGAGKFYVKVAGSTGEGTAAAASSSLYAAVESLSCIELESSDLVVDGEGFVFTVTFLSKTEMMSSAAMELWVMGALLQQGFRLMQSAF